MIIVVGQGVPSETPGRFDPFANKPMFDEAWKTALSAFAGEKIGVLGDGYMRTNEGWVGWANDDASSQAFPVVLRLELRLEADELDEPVLQWRLLVFMNGSPIQHPMAGRAFGPEEAKSLAAEIQGAKADAIREIRFTADAIKRLADGAGSWKPPLRFNTISILPGREFEAAFHGTEQGVAFDTKLAVSMELSGLSNECTVGLGNMQIHNRPRTGEDLANDVLRYLEHEDNRDRETIWSLLPGAERIRSMVLKALQEAGVEVKEGQGPNRIESNRMGISLRAYATIDGRNVSLFFVNAVRRSIIRSTDLDRVDPKEAKVSVSSASVDDPSKKVEIIPPLYDDQVTMDVVLGALREMGIVPKFKGKAKDDSEARIKAIEMVNKGDLLGAIQAAADLIDERMGDPTFFQSYLAALGAANKGEAAAVAQFVNSL